MREAIGPILRFILLKEKALAHRVELLLQHEDLMERLRGARQLEDIQYWLPDLNKLEDAINAASEPLAFRSKGPPSGTSSVPRIMQTLGVRSRRVAASKLPSAHISLAAAARRGFAARPSAASAGAASTATPLP